MAKRSLRFNETDRRRSVAVLLTMVVVIPFLAATRGGVAHASTCPDRGITWTAQTSAKQRSWRSVTYGNGLFVAVANAGENGGANRVMTSTDGITWTEQVTPTDGDGFQTSSWRSVTFGNGLFVAVADDARFSVEPRTRVMTSPDGFTWTARTAATANAWRSVTYGNGLFVAVAENGYDTDVGKRVMTSTDGITWTAHETPFVNLDDGFDGEVPVHSAWGSVAYGNGLFVAVAWDGPDRVMTSPDGVTWTARTTPVNSSNSWQSVTYGNGLFVAVTEDETNRQVITSSDGVTWTAQETPFVDVVDGDDRYNWWYSVTYGAGLFVAVATSGDNRAMTSTDGITWTARDAADDRNWGSVTYGNGLFVAVNPNTGPSDPQVMISGCIPESPEPPSNGGGPNIDWDHYLERAEREELQSSDLPNTL